MILNFGIVRAPVAAFLLLGAVVGSAHASIHRGANPGGMDRKGRFLTVPASHPAPATGAREEHPNEAARPDPPAYSPDAETAPAGIGCEPSQHGGGSFCLHPGLLKSRGE